jgi:hypothetical protein
MLQIITSLAGDPDAEVEWERLENLIRTICNTALCPIGQTSPFPMKAFLEILKGDPKATTEIEEKLEIVKCLSCGRPFAFQAYLEYFQTSVDKSLGVHLERDYCPECIRKVRATELVGEIAI